MRGRNKIFASSNKLLVPAVIPNHLQPLPAAWASCSINCVILSIFLPYWNLSIPDCCIPHLITVRSVHNGPLTCLPIKLNQTGFISNNNVSYGAFICHDEVDDEQRRKWQSCWQSGNLISSFSITLSFPSSSCQLRQCRWRHHNSWYAQKNKMTRKNGSKALFSIMQLPEPVYITKIYGYIDIRTVSKHHFRM